MMNRRITGAIITCAIIVMAGLSYAAAPTIGDLQGVWQSGYWQNGPGSTQSMLVEYRFRGDTLFGGSHIFLAQDCLNPARHLATDSIVCTVTIGEAVRDGIYRLNLKTVSQLTAPLSDSVAGLLNAARLYGYSDWSSGVFKDRAGKNDAGSHIVNPPNGTVLDAVCRLAADTLYIGRNAWPIPYGISPVDTILTFLVKKQNSVRPVNSVPARIAGRMSPRTVASGKYEISGRKVGLAPMKKPSKVLLSTEPSSK
jgi:hypothetical protein